MKSRRHHHKRSRWAHANTPEALRRRKAAADAKREAIAATLPPAYAPPQPLSHWQRVTIDLYVPAGSARCDQHAVVIDGERVGLLSATEIGRRVAARSGERRCAVRRTRWTDH